MQMRTAYVALCCWAGAAAEPLSETVCHLCAAARDRFATSMSGGHWALSTNAASSSRAASTAFGDTRTTTTRCIVRPQRQTSPDRQSVQRTPGTFSNSTQRIVGRSARSRSGPEASRRRGGDRRDKRPHALTARGVAVGRQGGGAPGAPIRTHSACTLRRLVSVLERERDGHSLV